MPGHFAQRNGGMINEDLPERCSSRAAAAAAAAASPFRFSFVVEKKLAVRMQLKPSMLPRFDEAFLVILLQPSSRQCDAWWVAWLRGTAAVSAAATGVEGWRR